jgi:hypothetical protein
MQNIKDAANAVSEKAKGKKIYVYLYQKVHE